ncbi:TonB-dependent siderophore receptor [Nitrobacter sp.]|uniref:TonB-dependent siderophore receptor n=1 Tax=Nitrobacter sp. TaxID=29420 RepID=UPI00399D596D
MAGSRIAKVALAGVSLASINTTLHAQTADPQTAAVQSAGTVNVSVPAGSLESGLLGLGRQTNLRMVYRSNLTAGKRTAGVSGQMTPPQAVRQLLAGTGLSAAFTTANTVQVYDPSAPVDVGALPSGAIPLPTISVTGQGEGTAEHGYRVETAKTTGPWGNKPILDTPYSINATSSELMQNRIVGSNDELFKFNPMVQLTRPTSAFGAPTVMIRGLDQTTASGFVLDGVPVRYSWLGGGMEDMERIEVLSGLSGFLYGANNVGGMVNYVTKRPTVTPLFNFTVGNYGGSQYFEHLDLGGPLDKEGKFAYRFNALYQDGNDAIGVGQRRANFSGAVDWNVTDSLKVSITAAHDDYRRTGTGGVGISFSTPGPIPSAKDFDNTRPLTPNWGFNYLKQDRVGANVQWDIDDETTLRAAALYLKETRFSSSPQPMGVLANGTYSFQAFRVFGPESNINGGYLYVDRKFDTFGIRHKVTFGTNFSGYDQYTFQNPPGASGTFPTLAAALNSAPLVFNSVYPFPGHRAVNFKNTNIVLGDDITLNRYFSILVGANRATIETYNYNTTGATTAAYDKSAVTPSASLIFKPTSNVSLYGTYIESLESGGTVSLTNIPPYTNAGAVLPATISKQVEVGAKANVGGVFLTLAAFQIDKANLYDTANPDGTLTRNQDGRQIHKGIELTATGKVTDDLTIMGGGYYLDPEVTKTNNAALLGKEPQRVSRWRGSLWGEYRLPFLKTLFLTGGVSYVGSSYVDALNTILVPSYTVGDVGLRYETAVNGTPVVMRLNVQNVADNHYWVNGSVLYQGLPRTYSFSATAKF